MISVIGIRTSRTSAVKICGSYGRREMVKTVWVAASCRGVMTLDVVVEVLAGRLLVGATSQVGRVVDRLNDHFRFRHDVTKTAVLPVQGISGSGMSSWRILLERVTSSDSIDYFRFRYDVSGVYFRKHGATSGTEYFRFRHDVIGDDAARAGCGVTE